MNSKVLREKRAEIVNEMRTLSDKLKNEKRSAFSEEERSQFDVLDKQQELLLAEAESQERVERVDGLSRSDSQNRVKEELLNWKPQSRLAAEERTKAYAGWFYHGTKFNKPEYWRASERMGIDPSNTCLRFDWLPWKDGENRGTSPQLSSTATAGGDLVAVDNSMMAQIDIALKYFGSVFEWAKVVDTRSGSLLPWPTVNDTATTGELTAQGSGINVQDLTFGQDQLSAYKIDSGFIKVSWELMQDSVIDLASFIGQAAGTRIGRKFNALAVATGTGTNQPTALLGSATQGGSTTASATAVTYSELVQLLESIDYAYQSAPGFAWVFSQNFRSALRQLVDDNSRPLMSGSLEGISQGIPPTLLATRYYINNDVPDLTASHKCAIIGDLSKFIVRRVTGEDGGLTVMRFNELYAANGLTAFLTWGRFDCLLSDAGTHPVKYLLSHS